MALLQFRLFPPTIVLIAFI